MRLFAYAAARRFRVSGFTIQNFLIGFIQGFCIPEARLYLDRRIHLTGERRDYYIAETDVWSMLFGIASERKKREFDPALLALRKAMESTEEGDDLVRERLGELEEILRAIERLLQRFLASEDASRAMLKFFSAQVPYPTK